MTAPAPHPDRPPERPSLKEISELIAWGRRLSAAAGIAGVPTAELTAYQTAKHDLLARINALKPENQ